MATGRRHAVLPRQSVHRVRHLAFAKKRVGNCSRFDIGQHRSQRLYLRCARRLYFHVHGGLTCGQCVNTKIRSAHLVSKYPCLNCMHIILLQSENNQLSHLDALQSIGTRRFLLGGHIFRLGSLRVQEKQFQTEQSNEQQRINSLFH